MNRNQQTHMGPSDACYYADHRGCPFPTMCECSCHKSLAGDSTPPATPVEPRVDAVAREVAKALMTNGLGERCDRLALLLGGSPIGAGWSLSGATAQIRETLEQEGYVLDRMAEADRRARASHPSAVSGEGERLKELEVLEYQIAGGGPFDREDVRLVRRRNRDGVSKWAVVNRGAALNADGEWEWEPIPSSRTDEYLARTRFATPEAALNVYRLRASTPTPGAPR